MLVVHVAIAAADAPAASLSLTLFSLTLLGRKSLFVTM
jgi:hypothetical protein